MNSHSGKKQDSNEARSNIEVARVIAEDLGIPELIAKILLARNIKSPDDARQFLKPRLEDLSEPFLMPDMEKGVERVISALNRKEIICLYGDYDADGVT